MKNITKLFVVLALCCSFALADGDMENGGRTTCTENCPPPPPCTVDCGSGQSMQMTPVEPASGTWIIVAEEIAELCRF